MATRTTRSKPVHTARTARKAKGEAQAKPLNRSLSDAKAAKQDDFYTQYVDIQKEVEAYLEYDPDTFRNKIVYCNCDDPFESNFFKYFAANCNSLGLKRLICTSYDGSPLAGQMTLFDEDNAWEWEAKEAQGPRPHGRPRHIELNRQGSVDGARERSTLIL